MTPTHPGKIVADRFEILRVAGSGGMGVVYQAHDRTTDRAVALKVLVERDQGPADRFAHEVELLSTLDHPHIVGYVTHGVTDQGSPYLVMPWLDGVDLEQRLAAGRLGIGETLTLAGAVASALAYLHGRGLVHRDLKPSNLFLPQGDVARVQVVDLGVARTTLPSLALTQSGVLIGTPGFIAPEQARGDREIAPTVDIFALGCVLFECVTGKRLFTGAHLMSVLAKILLEDAPRVRELRPDAPATLDLLIHRMVSKDPEKRPADGTQLVGWLADLHRAPMETQLPPPHVLTGSERRVVTVLVVILPSSRASLRPRGDETRAESDPFRTSSTRFGVRAHLVAERMAIVLAPERVSAADQASVLTRFARFVVEEHPGAIVALTTGSAVTGARVPVGEAIDRAVTMVRSAKVGRGVQVDDVTAALITARFDIRREGGGLLVDDERASLDPTRRLLGKPTSCVGRERELAILEATFAECAYGEGPKVVLVTAEAGAGKSRLRHELLRRISAEKLPALVLQCRGDPLHASTPYGMIAQTVRQAAGLREREEHDLVQEKLCAHVAAYVADADVARVSDFLGELVGVTFEDQGRLPLRAARHDAAAMADQIGRAFEDLLRAWCANQTVLIALEDLHWGDAASVKLIDRALRKLAGAKVFVLALARPEVHERFPALFGNRDVTTIRLPPLPKRASARLVQEVMGDGASAEDVERIVDRSEGNGFYLEELIRAAAESERRSNPPPASMRRDGLPETVLAVAQARLERLEPDVRRVLRAASVFGEVFWLEGVSALVGQDPAAVTPIIAALVEQEAIAPTEQPRLAGMRELAFRHTLLQGTAYATLTDEDRALGHRLAAIWLEQVGEDGEVVAGHWLESGERAEAAACLSRTAEIRWSRAQADAAAQCAARALLLGGGSSEPPNAVLGRVRSLANALEATRRIDVEGVLAGLHEHAPLAAGDDGPSVVLRALDQSLAPLRAADDHETLPVILVHAACALGALSDRTAAGTLLREATVRAGDNEAVVREIEYSSAKVAFWAGDCATALDILAETVLPADPRTRLEMLLILAVSEAMVGGTAALQRSLDVISRAEASLASVAGGLGSKDEDPVARVHVEKARFLCLHFASDAARAAQAAEGAVEIARRAGLRFDECAHLHNAGEQYLRLGYRERARDALLQSNAIAEDVGAEPVAQHNHILLAYIDGRAEQLATLAAAAQQATNPWLELNARYYLGHLLASKSDPSARAALESALRLATELKARTMADDCSRALGAL